MKKYRTVVQMFRFHALAVQGRGAMSTHAEFEAYRHVDHAHSAQPMLQGRRRRGRDRDALHVGEENRAAHAFLSIANGSSWRIEQPSHRVAQRVQVATT